ncbi:hypothetical protein IGI37_002518 [Enterococcus sp. AZ194]|uniref:hypothetical protein n=1 Tax=Enterococcus sp. AZ194 TaxID=2774629 RepID=UPI003F29CAE8
MKNCQKPIFLWMSVSLLLLLSGCQPIENWKTVGTREPVETGLSVENNRLYETPTLSFQTTSVTIQSAVQNNKQLMVSFDWVNEGEMPQTFVECYQYFTIYADEVPLELIDESYASTKKNAPGKSQSLTFTFTFEKNDAEILLFEYKPATEPAKRYSCFLEE